MLHLRLIVPTGKTDEVVTYLTGDAAVTHLVVLPAAAKVPPGDLVLCDVAREGASAVLECLRGLGLEDEGAITVEQVDVSMSKAARAAEKAAPGLGADAVVWEEVEYRTHEEVEFSATYLAFLSVATVIAAIGVLLDQPILIVGAMVVGPEFGPLAGLCVAIVQRRRPVAVRSLIALLVGFPVAILLTIVVTWLLTAAGVVDRGMLLADRPLTEFIWRPDALSWVVGFLAGIAGILSLTSSKSSALIGVLISVTTVPAAGNVAVALAYGVFDEAAGSALQLLINLVAIVLGGVLTLLVQRLAWQQRRLRPHRSKKAQAVADRAEAGN